MVDDTKRYYWLRLHEDFFQEERIAWLEEQENGSKYALFYLKLCLKTINSEGILMRNIGGMLIPYDQNRLAEITRTEHDTVKAAIEKLNQIGLAEFLPDGAIFLPEVPNMVGSESHSAYRHREAKTKKEKEQGGKICHQSATLLPPKNGKLVAKSATRDKRQETRDINNTTTNNVSDLVYKDNVDNSSDDVVVRYVDQLGCSVREARAVVGQYGAQRVQEVLSAAREPGIKNPVGWIKAALAGGWSMSHHRPEGEPMAKKNYAEQQSVADALVELMSSRGECWSASDYATTGLLTDHSRNTMMSLSAAMSAAGVTPEDLR